MKNNKPKVIAIVGPTASGKSSLAISLAKKWNGEIVSADSRQIYKGLDIGSGKVTKKEMDGIPHYMLDVWNPKSQISVSQYTKKAHSVVKDIVKRKKLPIICGGTGLYIDSLLLGESFPNVPPNKTLRASLQRKDTASLFAQLKKLDPRRAESIDPHNRVRLVRAIEIAQSLGRVPTRSFSYPYDVLWIGIDISSQELESKIKTRLIARMKKGMVGEIKKLHNEGVSFKRMYELGLEYRYISLFVQKKITREECVESLAKEIIRYAKRQMTWFKRNKHIVWIKPNSKDANTLISIFLSIDKDSRA